MNKYEKEVELAKLKAEKQELNHLKSIYNKATKDIANKIEISNGKINVLLKDFDELDDVQKSILQSQIYQRDFQLSLKKQIDEFLSVLQTEQYESIDEYLKKCYETGYIGSMYSIHGQGIPLIMPIDQKAAARAMTHDTKLSKRLYTKLGEDVNLLKKRIANNISRGIATADSYANIARNIANGTNVGVNRTMTIARTESHRIQVLGAVDAQQKAKDAGCDVVKQWDAALDGRTRPHHRQLDGQIRELDEPFEVDGMEVMYPSGFGKASEDINCRCALLQRARWALDEDELETLKERAAYYGLDKTKDFADYKKKYLKAAEKSHAKASSVKGITKPVRPKKSNFANDDEYKEARERYKIQKEKYEKQIDGIIQNALNTNPAFKTKDEVVKWVKDNGVSIDKEVLDVIDLRSFNEVKETLEEMFEKYPQLKSYEIEHFDGGKSKSKFKIGLTDDGLLSANGGFNFNRRHFQDYENGLKDALTGITEGFFVNGDGSFSTLVRHEFGHNVDDYIRLNISKKYHYGVDDWRKNFETFDKKKTADKSYLEEIHLYENELIDLSKMEGVSEYAQTNILELFAEGFAEYTSGGNSEFGNAFGKFLERWFK